MKLSQTVKVITGLLSILLALPVVFSGCAPDDVTETDGNVIYVDVNGDDAGDGTKEHPYRTLARAKEAVRAISGSATGDITVKLGEGVFTLDETFTLSQEDSGKNGHYVIYEGAGMGKTFISGGKSIEGWTLHDAEANIYKASVGDGMSFRQLYVNGEKAIRARSGKTGEYSTRMIGAERIKNGRVLPELLTVDNAQSRAEADDGTVFIKRSDGTLGEDWGNLSDIELHILTAWCVNILRVKSVTENGNKYEIKIADEEAALVFNRLHPNIDGYSHMNTRNFIYYVENAYELIDSDGEWYLDGSTNTVYYKAPKGLDPNSTEIIAPVLENIVSLGGTLDEPVKNIRFSGITFEHSSWTHPSEHGFVEAQAMQYVTRTVFATNDVAVGRPAAGILVFCAEGIEFIGNEIRNMGATGLDLYYGASGCLIMNNKVHDISGNGISVGKFAADDKVNDHEAYDPEDKREICEGDMIVNNEITNIGTDFESGIGIAAGYPKNILIANNTVSYGPYTGISVGFGWTTKPNAMSGNRIIRNEIHHVTTVLCDAGGIYTLSEQPSSEMAENYIHDIKLMPWADYGTCGVYLDEGTGGYIITENVLERAFDITPHITGINHIYGNFVYGVTELDRERIAEIKKNAGVRDDFSLDALPEKRKADTETDPTEGLTLEETFFADFESYEEGKLTDAAWEIPRNQTRLVSVSSVNGNKVLKLTSYQPNTKAHLTLSADDYQLTFDFNFADRLYGYEGMYNIVRDDGSLYTANLTPEYSTTVRLEHKGADEIGKAKPIKIGSWYTCKIAVFDDKIYIKVYAKGADEPSEWDLVKGMNGKINGDGKIGFEFYSSTGGSVYIDNISVKTPKK